MMFVVTHQMFSQTNIWLGNTNVWNAATNWSLGTAPINAPTVDVVIPSSPSGGQFPTITVASPSIGDLTIQDNAIVTVNTNTFLGTPLSLIVNKSVHAGNGVGSVISGTGFLVLQGSVPQSIDGKLNLRKFRLNNAAGASMANGAVMRVDSFVLLQAGVLSTTGASLVHKNNAYINNYSPNTYTGSINGDVTVERLITNSANGYRNFSSPVNTTVADLADDFSIFGQNGVQCWYTYSPYPNVQVYDEALSIVDGNYYEGWLSYTSPANTLAPMQGVAARTYAGGAFTVDFTGAPNDGPLSIALTNTTSSTPSQDGWNLVGNPYPSPIRWSLVKALNPGETSGSYYVFQTTGEYSGNWGSHNGVTGVNGARDSIGIAQGFFVQANGNTSLDMDNTVRSSSFAGYYKTEDELTNEVRLILSDGVNSDEIVAYTDNQINVQEWSAVKMPAGSTVYLSYDGMGGEYAIQVLESVDEETELPLNVYVSESGTYTVTALRANIPGFRAFLKDASTGALYDMSIAIPPFTLTGGQSYKGRFSVVFQPMVSAVETPGNDWYKIYAEGKEIHVTQHSTGKSEIAVSNLLGQHIGGASFNTSEGVVSVPAHFQGVAVVRLSGSGVSVTQKVFIH